jgi:hypothetical protein
MMKVLQIAEEKDLIFSKRDATSPIAIEKSTGRLVDILLKIQKEKELSKAREEAENAKKEREKMRREKWMKENPGEDPKYMGMTKQDIGIHKRLESGELELVDDD